MIPCEDKAASVNGGFTDQHQRIFAIRLIAAAGWRPVTITVGTIYFQWHSKSET